MKAVLISIKPKWCELIANGKKTLEVRKTRPKLETPFKCYIFCTKEYSMGLYNDELYRLPTGEIKYGCSIELACYDGYTHDNFLNGKVIGEFVCDCIAEFHDWQLSPGERFRDYEEDELHAFLKSACLSYEEVCKYRANLPYYKPIYGWHISELKIYDKPKELSVLPAACDCTFDEILCKHCNRFDNGTCSRKLRRAPQSWCYMEEVDT